MPDKTPLKTVKIPTHPMAIRNSKKTPQELVLARRRENNKWQAKLRADIKKRKAIGDKLTPLTKVSTAKAMKELGFSLAAIARELGIGCPSVRILVNQMSSKAIDKHIEKLKKMILLKEEKVAAKALSVMDKKVERAPFRDVTMAYKTLRELRVPQVAIQQNFQNFKLDKSQIERIIDE